MHEKKVRILVIEDEEQVRTLLSAILIKAGHEIEIVSNGEQGIDLFEENEHDIVITDLGMPGMTGWQVAERIKTINNKVPVVLITGWDITPEQLEMNRRGVDLIIHKPFEIEQVLSTVEAGILLRDRFNIP